MKTHSSLRKYTAGFGTVEYFIMVMAVFGIIAFMTIFSNGKAHAAASPSRPQTAEDVLNALPREQKFAYWQNWRHLPQGEGWQLATHEEMRRVVQDEFNRTGQRVYITSPDETSTFAKEPNAKLGTGADQFVTVSQNDKTIIVYMMSADGERVISVPYISPACYTLIKRTGVIERR